MDNQLPTGGSNSPTAQPARQPNTGLGDDIASKTPSPQKSPPPAPASPGAGLGGKELEVASTDEIPIEFPKTPEELIPPEVREAGVGIRPTTIELPPDLKKLGVQPGASGMPIVHQGNTKAAATAVALPLSDGEILAAEKVDTSLSLRWLAMWCLRQLMKAGFHLKVIHGKIFRVQKEQDTHA